jgi:hypothetical protein
LRNIVGIANDSWQSSIRTVGAGERGLVSSLRALRSCEQNRPPFLLHDNQRHRNPRSRGALRRLSSASRLSRGKLESSPFTMNDDYYAATRDKTLAAYKEERHPAKTLTSGVSSQKEAIRKVLSGLAEVGHSRVKREGFPKSIPSDEYEMELDAMAHAMASWRVRPLLLSCPSCSSRSCRRGPLTLRDSACSHSTGRVQGPFPRLTSGIP